MQILKIGSVWLKMAVARLILELQKNLKNLFSQKKYFNWGLFSKFLL